VTSFASRALKIRLKLHDSSDDNIEKTATKAAALLPVFGTIARRRMMA